MGFMLMPLRLDILLLPWQRIVEEKPVVHASEKDCGRQGYHRHCSFFASDALDFVTEQPVYMDGGGSILSRKESFCTN
jgi:hypothetical protein